MLLARPSPLLATTFQAPAEVGTKCNYCCSDELVCSWTPDRLAVLCKYCADRPRRLVSDSNELIGYGQFTWAHACDCNGGW